MIILYFIVLFCLAAVDISKCHIFCWLIRYAQKVDSQKLLLCCCKCCPLMVGPLGVGDWRRWNISGGVVLDIMVDRKRKMRISIVMHWILDQPVIQNPFTINKYSWECDDIPPVRRKWHLNLKTKVTVFCFHTICLTQGTEDSKHCRCLAFRRPV